MAPQVANTRLEVSKEALKTIYYVVIGIAITEALSRTFVQDCRFLGFDLLKLQHLPVMLLLLTFLVTSSRFVHGASIHFGDIHVGGGKVLLDFCGFFFQAILFYVMSLSVRDSFAFLVSFSVLLVADGLWLLALRCLHYLPFGKTERQWFWSDLVIFLILVALVYSDPTLSLLSISIVAAVSSLALVVDYARNWAFYFPRRLCPSDLDEAG